MESFLDCASLQALLAIMNQKANTSVSNPQKAPAEGAQGAARRSAILEMPEWHSYRERDVHAFPEEQIQLAF